MNWRTWERKQNQRDRYYNQHYSLMKKESSTNLQKYSGIEASEFIRLAEQDKSTTLDRVGDIIGPGYTTDIDPDKEEHNLSETEKYFQRWTKRNNNGKDEVRV